MDSHAELLPRLDISDALRAEAHTLLDAASLDRHRPFAVLHPGSGGSARDWSVSRFAELAQRLGQQAEGIQTLITGTAAEQQLVEAVVRGSGGHAHALAAPVPLTQLAAILAEARLCVANSTGPLHLAAAVDTPVLGLYPFERVQHPRRWGPLGSRTHVLLPPQDPDCKDCAAGSCALHDDMSRIGCEEAFAAALELLSSPSPH